MKTGIVTVIYVAFGIFFLFMSIWLFMGIGGVESPYSRSVSVLDVSSLLNMAASLLFMVFLLLTLRSFKAELFGE